MLPPEWEIPLKTAALPGVLSRYSPQFHQPDVLLCAPQDYPYVRCSRNYRHSVECKHKNLCFCCLVLACFLGFPTRSNCLSCALRHAQGERNLVISEQPSLPTPNLEESKKLNAASSIEGVTVTISMKPLFFRFSRKRTAI